MTIGCFFQRKLQRPGKLLKLLDFPTWKSIAANNATCQKLPPWINESLIAVNSGLGRRTSIKLFVFNLYFIFPIWLLRLRAWAVPNFLNFGNAKRWGIDTYLFQLRLQRYYLRFQFWSMLPLQGIGGFNIFHCITLRNVLWTIPVSGLNIQHHHTFGIKFVCSQIE